MKVVILGGGYGGIFAASNLCKNKDNVDVTLVNDGPAHQLIQNLHRVSSGELAPDEVQLEIGETLGQDIEFIHGKAERVKLNEKCVDVRLNNINGEIRSISYDCLVIALGAVSDYFGIKGVKKYTIPLRSVSDAVRLHEAILQLGEGAVITIAGGGATGISLAGALSEGFGKFLKIRIVEARDEILSGWDPVIIHSVRRFLGTNVEIITGKAITEMHEKEIVLSSGEILASDVTVWTAGIRGQELSTAPDDALKTKTRRFIVDQFSQIQKPDGSGPYDHVFAIGDISAFPINSDTEGGGLLSPQLAQFAVRQARNVAKNILRIAQGIGMEKLEYRQQGQVISLGRNNCAGVINGIPICGWLCSNVEDFVIDNYIRAIRKRGESIESLAYDSPSSLTGEIAATFNFVNHVWIRFLNQWYNTCCIAPISEADLQPGMSRRRIGKTDSKYDETEIGRRRVDGVREKEGGEEEEEEEGKLELKEETR